VIELHLDSEEAQDAFGRRLATQLQTPLIVLLKGDLGTGKTTLVRGILRGLGHSGSVRSPTYTLLEPYQLGEKAVFHLDLYRLGDPQELEYLGLRDLLEEDSLLFVEWPERAGGNLPAPDLDIEIDYAPPGRTLRVAARTPAGELVLRRLAVVSGSEAPPE
jgi:tRNA threonylcarbamoyladenosine biosynthesis protein TsaE